ncbi:MAG TPA: alpha/beta hydrolase domain-containing protein [Spongiibacteraceae bacterium]
MKIIKMVGQLFVSNSVKRLAIFSAVFLLHACGSSSHHTEAVPNPTIEGPITGSPYLNSTSFDLASVGYEQAEYFISGNARNFINDDELQSNGKWRVKIGASALYKTRIVVYRPIDAHKFNGTVVIEWLNVSGGIDAGPDWTMAHTELIRQGYAWVGVSAQAAGIDGSGFNITGFQLNLKTVDPARYGSLLHPGDSFSYDMFSQAAQAVLHPQNIDPLDGLRVQRALAIGESQSAFRLVTYVDALALSARLFDGYFIHSRGHGSAALSETPQTAVAMPATVFIRNDLRVPMMMLQTETDLFGLDFYPDRQADSPMFRLWEVAGTAHADTYTLSVGASDLGNDPNIANVLSTAAPIPGIIECEHPVNSGPQHFVVSAAIAALDNWARNGVAPAHADRLEVSGTPPAFVLDSVGNVQGGVRTPYVDAPIAKLSGAGQTSSILCGLLGTTELFDSTTLSSLYPNHATYVAAVKTSVDNAVINGFLLPPDGELIKVWAQASTIGNP